MGEIGEKYYVYFFHFILTFKKSTASNVSNIPDYRKLCNATVEDLGNMNPLFVQFLAWQRLVQLNVENLKNEDLPISHTLHKVIDQAKSKEMDKLGAQDGNLMKSGTDFAFQVPKTPSQGLRESLNSKSFFEKEQEGPSKSDRFERRETRSERREAKRDDLDSDNTSNGQKKTVIEILDSEIDAEKSRASKKRAPENIPPQSSAKATKAPPPKKKKKNSPPMGRVERPAYVARLEMKDNRKKKIFYIFKI